MRRTLRDKLETLSSAISERKTETAAKKKKVAKKTAPKKPVMGPHGENYTEMENIEKAIEDLIRTELDDHVKAVEATIGREQATVTITHRNIGGIGMQDLRELANGISYVLSCDEIYDEMIYILNAKSSNIKIQFYIKVTDKLKKKIKEEYK